MKITIKNVKEAAPAIGAIFLAVYCFGKLVDSQVDTDKNWKDYLKSKEGK